jgi:hypothetical protein
MPTVEPRLTRTVTLPSTHPRRPIFARTPAAPARHSAGRTLRNLGGQTLWGWSPPRLPADTPGKRLVDRVLPFTGWPLALYFGAIVVALNLASHLPTRVALALVGVGIASGREVVAANFWRCRHAHYVVTGAGWLALSGFAFVEAAVGYSVIGGNEGLVWSFSACWPPASSSRWPDGWYAARTRSPVDDSGRARRASRKPPARQSIF